MRPSGGLEVAEIFRQHGPAYRESHRLSRNALRVMRAIEVCRTAVLGGHKDQCDHCGLLANRKRKAPIALCRKILGDGKTVTQQNDRKDICQEQLFRICGIDLTLCPVCHKGKMYRVALLLPLRCNSP